MDFRPFPWNFGDQPQKREESELKKKKKNRRYLSAPEKNFENMAQEKYVFSFVFFFPLFFTCFPHSSVHGSFVKFPFNVTVLHS